MGRDRRTVVITSRGGLGCGDRRGFLSISIPHRHQTAPRLGMAGRVDGRRIGGRVSVVGFRRSRRIRSAYRRGPDVQPTQVVVVLSHIPDMEEIPPPGNAETGAWDHGERLTESASAPSI